MSEENDFLHCIRENPDDTDLRLTYADWLEERGDLRATMVRIEEELRSVPIYSDRYWELKPQRHAFQDYCEEKHYGLWLRQMRYHRRYQPVFGDVPTDVRSRWRLIREFIERWHGIRVPDLGETTPEITRLETALGTRLPESVRQWSGLVRDLGDQFREVFRDRPLIDSMSRFHAICLMILSEGDVYWAIRDTTLDLDDPPVGTLTRTEARQPHPEIAEVYASTTAFALTHASCFLGRGFTGHLAADKLASLGGQQGIQPVQWDDVAIYEAENALLLANDDSIRVAIWGDTDPLHVNSFFRQLL